MKKYVVLLFIVFSSSLLAQKVIEVSDKYATVLIFDSPVNRFILGNNKSYSIVKDTIQNPNSKRTLEIKYTPKNSSYKKTKINVFTSDGNVYDFKLNYNQEPLKTIHFIGIKEAIGNMGAATSKEKRKVVSNQNEIVNSPVAYYSDGVVTEKGGDFIQQETLSKAERDSIVYARVTKKCRENPAVKQRISRKFAKAANIKFLLKEITYDMDEIYFHLSIENKGQQAFDIKNMICSILNAKAEGTKQKNTLLPLYEHNMPSRVFGNTTAHFIVVFEKFNITNKSNFQIDISEQEGGRILRIKIHDNLINNPNKL